MTCGIFIQWNYSKLLPLSVMSNDDECITAWLYRGVQVKILFWQLPFKNLLVSNGNGISCHFEPSSVDFSFSFIFCFELMINIPHDFGPFVVFSACAPDEWNSFRVFCLIAWFWYNCWYHSFVFFWYTWGVCQNLYWVVWSCWSFLKIQDLNVIDRPHFGWL